MSIQNERQFRDNYTFGNNSNSGDSEFTPFAKIKAENEYTQEAREVRQNANYRRREGSDAASGGNYYAFERERASVGAKRARMNHRNAYDAVDSQTNGERREQRGGRAEFYGDPVRKNEAGSFTYSTPHKRANAEALSRRENLMYKEAAAERDYNCRSKNNKKVEIDMKLLVSGILLFVFLFISFIIIAFLPPKTSNAEKGGTEPTDGRNMVWDSDMQSDGGDSAAGAVPDDADSNKFIICIDPGHGYDDTGTSHKNLGALNEKDINLKVALLAVQELRDRGYDVIMTRDSDKPDSSVKANSDGKYLINPAWRCDFANTNKVSLFVSLHCNSFEDESVKGARVYYCKESRYDSEKLSNKISKSIENIFSEGASSVTGLDEKSAYAVTKRVEAPSVLVEMGFVTNKTDAKNLTDEAWQKKMASAVAQGIISYVSENPKN